MKHIMLIISIIITCNAFSEEPKVDVSKINVPKTNINISNSENIVLSFERIEITQLIELVYTDILKISYIMHDDVLKKIKPVTIRLSSSNHKKSELNNIMGNLLQDYGISIEKKDRYILFRLSESREEPKMPFFYKPKHRNTMYLVNMISSVINAKDAIVQKRELESSNKKDNKSEEGMNKMVDKDSDGILIMTTQKKIDLINQLLKELDTPEKQVHIQALVYEVQSSNNESNAIQAVLKTIGKLGINMSVGASRGAGQIFEVSTKDLSILMNIFNGDNQFKVITSPSLFVKSGQKANFSVGTETPTLSGIKYPDGNSGAPIQSVEYRKSGTIFEVKPKIHEETIDIELNQEISNFVTTTTGVSNSPTLIKRALKSEFSMKSGQMIILAGLKEKKDTLDSTYLPFTKWEIGRENTHSQSEIILILHCQLVDGETNKSHPLDLYDFIQTIPTLEQPLVNSLK